MTNNDLWEQEISRLSLDFKTIQRSPQSWKDGKSAFSEEAHKAYQKLQSARMAQWARQDYLLWKLSYDK